MSSSGRRPRGRKRKALGQDTIQVRRHNRIVQIPIQSDRSASKPARRDVAAERKAWEKANWGKIFQLSESSGFLFAFRPAERRELFEKVGGLDRQVDTLLAALA